MLIPKKDKTPNYDYTREAEIRLKARQAAEEAERAAREAKDAGDLLAELTEGAKREGTEWRRIRGLNEETG